MENKINITDRLADFVKTFNLPEYIILIPDIISGILLIYLFFTGNGIIYTNIAKSTLVFFLVRYLFNLITNFKNTEGNTEGKNKFQLNGYLGFAIIVILMHPVLDLTNITKITLIVLYTLFLSGIGNGYTTNNIITSLLVSDAILKCS